MQRKTKSYISGSVRRPTAAYPPHVAAQSGSGRPTSLLESTNHPSGQFQVVRVIVNRDEKGYGMKVSGDNPVYVQSVKEGGAAERSGLHSGDKIIEVNGVNVAASTHTEVVSLIRSSSQVVLTVQQRTVGQHRMGSPTLHNGPLTTHPPAIITAPQPVNDEKLFQLQLEREQHFRLMIEKEERYLEALRGQLARSSDEKKILELEKAERNLQKLQGMLQNHVRNQNESTNHTHHRTKSSSEHLLLSPAEASKRLIASESMSELRSYYNTTATPPGTPPPPYPSPVACRKSSDGNSANTEDVDIPCDETPIDYSSPDISPLRGSGPSLALARVLANTSSIHAANSQTTQQSIMSMEDDEISDQEINQLEDHDPFRSLALLWDHTPHLAVFMNYVLLNSDPDNLLFYVLTNLYKEGNVKEMKKWAYEIHSSFLIPGAPLHLNNVEENTAHEIDDVLTREYDKEEIMREIFRKARNKTREELTKQLSDFQQKRTAGLGTIYGPPDTALAEIVQDKAREQKFYENLFLDKLDPYVEEVEKEIYDPRKYYIAVALITVIIRVFGVRSTSYALDRFPTFVNKEKSFRPKFIKYSRKISILGHTYVAQQYYTVISCYHCHQILYGIGPQGYQCLICGINLHRLCVKLYEDICPGPITKKGIHKLMDFKTSKEPRRKLNSTQLDRKVIENRDSGLDSSEGGDSKPGQPVIRTESERIPDSLREEPTKAQDVLNHSEDTEEDTTTTESSKSLPATITNKKKSNSNINRSESVKEQVEKKKQRRNISDPLRNTSETVDIDNDRALGYQANNGSTSNSSLSSGCSNDSASNSVDNTFTVVAQSGASNRDNDNNYIEADPPDWQSSLSEEELARLQPYEKQRQDVINELFHTEKSHLRNLKVLERVFRKRIQEQKLLKDDEISLLFPNLSDLISIHSKFNTLMMSKRKEVVLVRDLGETLISMFDGPMGESFQQAAATSCKKQQHALDFIKEKRRKDSKFETYLTEFEKDPACKRLPLQGFIPSEMQRLSKYPLLLERLIEVVEKNLDNDQLEYSQLELSKLQQAYNRSREILNYVNEAAKQAWSKFRLQEIQKHLDTSVFDKTEHAIVNEFKNLDLTRYNLIYEGTVQLKRQNKGLLNVHMVLLEEVVILLQKENERFLLKFFQSGITGQQPLAPIIKMSTLLVRTNAALKCSLFLVNTSSEHSQMHELLTRDNTERKTWFKHLSDTAEAYNKREGKSKQPEPTLDEEETVVELPSTIEPTERAESVGGSEISTQESDLQTPSTDSCSSSVNENKRLSHLEDETNATPDIGNSTASGVSMKFAVDDWPLIQPYEVQAEIPPIHSAAPVLTPIEQIKRKGAVVRQALEDKEKLVADLLSIPREEYHYIADMAIEDAKNKDLAEKEPTSLVLASVYQVDQLLSAVNQSLDISEGDAVLMTGGKHPSCTSNETLVLRNNVPSIPVYRLQEIATTLNSQLTTLLSLIKQRDEERDRLRKELQRTREQLHEKLSFYCSSQYSDEDMPQATVMQPADLESIEENPTENEST